MVLRSITLLRHEREPNRIQLNQRARVLVAQVRPQEASSGKTRETR